MNGPRVLFVSSSLEVGGAERHLSVLLPMLADRGAEPSVVTLRAKGGFFDALTAKGIPARFLPVRSRFDVAGMRRAVREVGGWPEVVVSQGLDAQVVGSLFARRAGAVHVTVHHKQPELRIAFHRRLLTRLVARRIDGVIAVSAAQIPDLVSLGFRRDRIEVIENGVPEPTPTSSPGEVRASLGLAPDDLVALMVATLRPEKRAGVFVDALAVSHGREPRIRGLLAGNGPDFEDVRARAGASGAVSVLGERTDVPDLMLAADVVCLTSRAEALPMVILEAMALGRPVIATDVGGIAEAVVDGETGVVTAVDDGRALADALLELAAEPSLARSMGAAGRRRYEERYSAEQMADRYACTLRKALGTP